MARYTLATGEPIWAAFLRTPPSPGFWAWVYSGLHLFQLGWPGWALAGGTTAAALFLGRAPRDEDHAVVLALGYLLFAAAVGAVLLSRRGQDLLWHADRILLIGPLLFPPILPVVLAPPPCGGRSRRASPDRSSAYPARPAIWTGRSSPRSPPIRARAAWSTRAPPPGCAQGPWQPP